jgi:hypothetical protein
VPVGGRYVSHMRYYARHYLHPGSHPVYGDVVSEPEYDVTTELWYDDRRAFEEQQESLRSRPDAIAAVIADEEELFDRAKTRTVYVEDHVPELGRGEQERWLWRLRDKDEIVDLVHRYSYLIDHKRADELIGAVHRRLCG